MGGIKKTLPESCLSWTYILDMIFITLGNQNFQFERLLKRVEDLILKGVITDKVVAQTGFTVFNSKLIETVAFLSKEEFNEYIDVSDYVISHAGTGSIISCLTKNKKVIVASRLKQHKEHIDDHQLEILQVFKNKKLIIGLNQELSDFEEKVLSVKNINVDLFVSNNNKFNKDLIKIIEG